MKKIKEKVRCLLGKAAIKSAENSANQTCLWWIYQPKLPDKVQKMRKF